MGVRGLGPRAERECRRGGGKGGGRGFVAEETMQSKMPVLPRRERHALSKEIIKQQKEQKTRKPRKHDPHKYCGFG